MVNQIREKQIIFETVQIYQNEIPLHKFPKKYLKEGYSIVYGGGNDEDNWFDIKLERLETDEEFTNRCASLDMFARHNEKQEYATYLRLKQKYENG